MKSKTGSNPRSDSLIRDIAAVDKRLRAALDDPRRIDRVRGPWGANSPYEEFTPKLAPLFERACKVFEQGQMVLARDAYAALSGVLALKDGYGFAVTRPASVVVKEEQARYLRCGRGGSRGSAGGAVRADHAPPEAEPLGRVRLDHCGSARSHTDGPRRAGGVVG